MVHSQSWIETAPAVARLQPENFDWEGWCDYVKELLPMDIYYTWHILSQPHTFDYATEALYWDPLVPLAEFDDDVHQSIGGMLRTPLAPVGTPRRPTDSARTP